jgi:hypothetical protein
LFRRPGSVQTLDAPALAARSRELEELEHELSETLKRFDLKYTLKLFKRVSSVVGYRSPLEHPPVSVLNAHTPEGILRAIERIVESSSGVRRLRPGGENSSELSKYFEVLREEVLTLGVIAVERDERGEYRTISAELLLSLLSAVETAVIGETLAREAIAEMLKHLHESKPPTAARAELLISRCVAALGLNGVPLRYILAQRAAIKLKKLTDDPAAEAAFALVLSTAVKAFVPGPTEELLSRIPAVRTADLALPNFSSAQEAIKALLHERTCKVSELVWAGGKASPDLTAGVTLRIGDAAASALLGIIQQILALQRATHDARDAMEHGASRSLNAELLKEREGELRAVELRCIGAAATVVGAQVFSQFSKVVETATVSPDGALVTKRNRIQLLRYFVNGCGLPEFDIERVEAAGIMAVTQLVEERVRSGACALFCRDDLGRLTPLSTERAVSMLAAIREG